MEHAQSRRRQSHTQNVPYTTYQLAMSIHTSVPRATGLSTFKLSVWTPFVPQTALRTSPAVATPDSTPPAPLTGTEWTEDSSDLLQEVFSWRMLEDAFGGILDPIARARLTALLSEPLAP